MSYTDAQILELKERLIAYQTAELKILRNQEYTVRDRTFKKANLPEVRKAIRELQLEIVRAEQGGVKGVLAIPRMY